MCVCLCVCVVCRQFNLSSLSSRNPLSCRKGPAKESAIKLMSNFPHSPEKIFKFAYLIILKKNKKQQQPLCDPFSADQSDFHNICWANRQKEKKKNRTLPQEGFNNTCDFVCYKILPQNSIYIEFPFFFFLRDLQILKMNHHIGAPLWNVVSKISHSQKRKKWQYGVTTWPFSTRDQLVWIVMSQVLVPLVELDHVLPSNTAPVEQN